MSFRFKCPYCFKEMSDDEVLFRSEKIDLREKDDFSEDDLLPGPYDDIEMFEDEYVGEDKEKYLKNYRDWKEWEMFHPRKDPVYEEFWKKYGGTTEKNLADDQFGVEAYHRRIIDPNRDMCLGLKKKDGVNCVFVDADGMAAWIEYESGEKSERRICPHCHNPLPKGYGKNPVRFVTVVGIANSGKTVFLAQLLKNIKTYCAKIGVSALSNSPSVQTFLADYSIAKGTRLPSPTPKNRFQQPLFFQITRNEEKSGEEKRVTETLVLYDVAGEVFESDDTVSGFAPFIEHADGLMVLIDPMQFPTVQEISENDIKADPTTALDAIHNIISRGKQEEKCKIPLAICISKADCNEMQKILGNETIQLLLDGVQGISDGKGYNKALFNMDGYRPLEKKLRTFFQQDNLGLATFMHNNYASYSFFAFSSLGQESETRQAENGEEYSTPVGNVVARRIEEPLFWLFYQFGYIGRQGLLEGEFECPNCGSIHNHELQEGTLLEEKEKGLFGFMKKVVPREINRECDECGFQWNTKDMDE